MNDIDFTRDGAVAIVALDRETKRNAVTLEMQHALAAAFARIAADATIRAVVLTGHGTDLCVGGDRGIADRLDDDSAFRAAVTEYHRRTIGGLLALDVPVVGAVEGAAFGFGAELVACCDLVVLGATALLADPHVPYGLAPAPVLLVAWPQQTSRRTATELILTGRQVAAEEAVALGLANQVVPAGEARGEALRLAQSLAIIAPRAVVPTKRALRPAMAEIERFYPDPPAL